MNQKKKIYCLNNKFEAEVKKLDAKMLKRVNVGTKC